METEALERLRAFRQVMYTTFGCRRDALVEILDALLTSPVIEHPAHLSLAPASNARRRRVYDALNAGTMSLPRLEQVVATHPLETPTAWYAVDASVWPRNDADTSAERGYYYHHTRHSHDESIIAGWNSSWLVQLPLALLQLDRAPTRASDAAGRKRQSGRSPRRFVHFCANAEWGSPVQRSPSMPAMTRSNWAWRWRKRRWVSSCACAEKRTFYADPPPGPTGGRPRRHGTKFACVDPTTWPAPQAEWKTTDAHSGWVRLQCWSGLHPIPHRHAKRGTRASPPARPRDPHSTGGGASPQTNQSSRPLWLWWWGPDRRIWKLSGGCMSPGSRSNTPFVSSKQVLKWTTPKSAHPRRRIAGPGW